MAFPITYREVRELVRGRALQTLRARHIVRKSGFVAGSDAPAGQAPATVIRYGRWQDDTWPVGVTPEERLTQYSRALNRLNLVAITAGATVPISQSGYSTGTARAMTRLWLGGYTELRALVVMSEDTPGLLLTIGIMDSAIYDDRYHAGGVDASFMLHARFPDTAQLLTTGTSTQSGGTGSPLTPLVAPITVTPWVAIDETFLEAGEILASIFLRNTNSPGGANITPKHGICELQAR